MKTITLNIVDEIGTPSALTQEQGNMIFEKIEKALNKETTVELDFAQVESMISPFLNNSIGQLYSKFTSEQLQKHLKIINFPDDKKSTLNIVISNAKRYYIDKEKYNTSVKEVFNP